VCLPTLGREHLEPCEYGVDVVLFLKQITTWVSLEIDYEKGVSRRSWAIPVVQGYINTNIRSCFSFYAILGEISA